MLMRTPKAAALGVGVALVLLLSIAGGDIARGEDQKVERAAERFADWTRPVFPAAEHVARREAALARLSENEVLLVPSAEGTSTGDTFRQLDDFEYFVGLEVVRSVLVLDGRTRKATLFTPASDPRFENPERPNDFPGRPAIGDPSLGRLSGLDDIQEGGGLEPRLEAMKSRGARIMINTGVARLGAPAAAAAMFEARTPEAALAAHLSDQYPDLQVESAHPLIAALRMVKSDREVAIMRRAAQATVEAISRGGARVRPGIDERTLTGAFIADCLAMGGQRVPFTPIIKSGENSLWPWRILGAHYDRRNRVLGPGEMVIYDVGCEVDHYVSDVGRTFPVSERFTPRQRELVEMVRKISDAVIAAARPGITLKDLQLVAEAVIPKAARPYMQAPFYFGHHLGLDAGDPSLADALLSPGMIFTIEPWYYNHDEKVAAFIEDEILITAKGSENLTAGLPRDPDGLERMRRARPPSGR